MGLHHAVGICHDAFGKCSGNSTVFRKLGYPLTGCGRHKIRVMDVRHGRSLGCDRVGNFLADHQVAPVCVCANLGSLDVSTPPNRSINEIKLEIFDSGKSCFGYFVRILEIVHCIVRKLFFIPGFTLLLICGSLAPSIAQNGRKIDSLETVISQGIPDTTRVNAFIDLSDLYAFKDFSKSLTYTTKAIELTEKIKAYQLKQRAAQRLALNYYYKGDFTNALKYESIGLQGAISSKDSVADRKSVV